MKPETGDDRSTGRTVEKWPYGPRDTRLLKPLTGAAQLQINIVLDYSSFYHLAQLQRTMNGNICNNYMSGFTKKRPWSYDMNIYGTASMGGVTTSPS